MSYNTRQQWVDMMKRTSNAAAQIMYRIDALDADSKGIQTVSVAPDGFAAGDEVYSTRLLTTQEKNAIKQKIATLANAVIADWQASIAP